MVMPACYTASFHPCLVALYFGALTLYLGINAVVTLCRYILMILEILFIFQAVGVCRFYSGLVMMGIMELCGKQFWLAAFCEAKDVTRAIKMAARILIEMPASADFSFHYRIVMGTFRCNPAPVCAFSFMLLVGGVCSAHFAFDKFILYWPLNIIIYFGDCFMGYDAMCYG